eukprot:Opistho-2@78306
MADLGAEDRLRIATAQNLWDTLHKCACNLVTTHHFHCGRCPEGSHIAGKTRPLQHYTMTHLNRIYCATVKGVPGYIPVCKCSMVNEKSKAHFHCPLCGHLEVSATTSMAFDGMRRHFKAQHVNDTSENVISAPSPAPIYPNSDDCDEHSSAATAGEMEPTWPARDVVHLPFCPTTGCRSVSLTDAMKAAPFTKRRVDNMDTGHQDPPSSVDLQDNQKASGDELDSAMAIDWNDAL